LRLGGRIVLGGHGGHGREFQVSGFKFQVFNADEFAYNFRMSDSLRLKDQPASERPRERLVARGPDALTHAELIAILLRTGLKGVNVVQVGQNLLQKFGSLNALALASVDEIRKIPGIGRDKAATLVAAFALARRMEQERREESPVLDNPVTVVNFMRESNRLKNVEAFQVLLLNTRKKLIRVEEISEGTLDTILVHPREVFRAAISANAAAIVLVHNHPSGDPTPSEADIKVTRDIIRAGQLLKIEVVDHVIIGRTSSARAKDFCSLRELGYFYA
jgi:DNA repair protein RadC